MTSEACSVSSAVWQSQKIGLGFPDDTSSQRVPQHLHCRALNRAGIRREFAAGHACGLQRGPLPCHPIAGVSPVVTGSYINESHWVASTNSSGDNVSHKQLPVI